jgi:hypothetical protein
MQATIPGPEVTAVAIPSGDTGRMNWISMARNTLVQFKNELRHQ